MSGPSKVYSTDAIEGFRAALSRFEMRAQNSVDGLLAEVRRAMDWLEHECPRHWKDQTKQAEDAVHEAKQNLERCLTFSVTDERPACREQKAALKQAQNRLAYCREKRERVKHWKRVMKHECFEYEARMSQLQRIIEIDMPAARNKLKDIVSSIDAYQVEKPVELRRNISEQSESKELN